MSACIGAAELVVWQPPCTHVVLSHEGSSADWGAGWHSEQLFSCPLDVDFACSTPSSAEWQVVQGAAGNVVPEMRYGWAVGVAVCVAVS
jgi:hypothetical protein